MVPKAINAAVAVRSLFKGTPRARTADDGYHRCLGDFAVFQQHSAKFCVGPTRRPAHAGGFFFGLRFALRRPVDVAGVALVATLFGGFGAAESVKRDAHLCSKRR